MAHHHLQTDDELVEVAWEFTKEHADHDGVDIKRGEWGAVMSCPECTLKGRDDAFQTVTVGNDEYKEAAGTLKRDRAVTFY